MKKELPFVMLEHNYGAQYHMYFLSIALTNPQNRYFVYENYIGLSVKHEMDSHIDYAFDGIYTCDRGIMNKFIIRGPVKNIHDIIKRSIDNGCYTILNINEQFLPNRQAYGNHYFRHDVLVVGYDDKTSEYITIGFDKNMNYSIVRYDRRIMEQAYYTMQSEWDFEVFVFRLNSNFYQKPDKQKIKKQLEIYCVGDNPGKFYFEDFLEQPDQSVEFVNNNYVGDYYGIHVYDYLIQRIKKQCKILGQVREEDKLGVLDMRSLNVLRTHSIVMKDMVQDVVENIPEDVIDTLEKIEKKIMGVRILILKFFSDGEKKRCRKAVENLKWIKERERWVIEQIIALL